MEELDGVLHEHEVKGLLQPLDHPLLQAAVLSAQIGNLLHKGVEGRQQGGRKLGQVLRMGLVLEILWQGQQVCRMNPLLQKWLQNGVEDEGRLLPQEPLAGVPVYHQPLLQIHEVCVQLGMGEGVGKECGKGFQIRVVQQGHGSDDLAFQGRKQHQDGLLHLLLVEEGSQLLDEVLLVVGCLDFTQVQPHQLKEDGVRQGGEAFLPLNYLLGTVVPLLSGGGRAHGWPPSACVGRNPQEPLWLQSGRDSCSWSRSAGSV